MSGFDCQFTKEPPEVLQCYCPICLLILREPYQVTCCGKSFCRDCIQKIKAKSQPCPTCMRPNFTSFQNKGLQQPLYGLRVFCSNKEKGCGWQRELGQLDQHLYAKDNCCNYAKVQCLFCGELYQRQTLKTHQDSECVKRPFTCKMCNDYKSTYEDVTTDHAPECKCRPVECPNSCGASNLQHQHIEIHVSSQCPLTLVECEFSDAGCDAKVYRRDLPSHLSTDMATHMSLLARENRKLKEEVKILKEKHQQETLESKKVISMEKSLNETEKKVSLFFSQRTPPFSVHYRPDQHTSAIFYSHMGGYKLQLELKLKLSCDEKYPTLLSKYTVLPSEFPVELPCKFTIKLEILEKKEFFEVKTHFYSDRPPEWQESGYIKCTNYRKLNFKAVIKEVHCNICLR